MSDNAVAEGFQYHCFETEVLVLCSRYWTRTVKPCTSILSGLPLHARSAATEPGGRRPRLHASHPSIPACARRLAPIAPGTRRLAAIPARAADVPTTSGAPYRARQITSVATRGTRHCRSGTAPPSSNDPLNNAVPLLRIRIHMSLKRVLALRRQRLHTAQILALDAEGVTIQAAKRALRQIQTRLGLRVARQIILGLKLVQKLRGGDGVEAGVELSQHAAFALEAALEERLRGAVILHREGDAVDGTGSGVGVDEDVGFAGHEAVPLVQGIDGLGSLHHLRVHGFLVVELIAGGLHEVTEALLEGLHDVGFKLGEVALYG